ncbi:MAG: hypothetical protein ACE3L7_26195 [Candidatus Pristimantibacillus sp.]
MNSRLKRPYIGHMIRWIIIIAAFLFLFRACYAPQPWKLENVIHEATAGMELPDAELVSKVYSGDGIWNLLLIDRENSMWHHLNVSHKFALLWSNKGGGYGMPLESDILLNFRGGMSTFGKNRHFYFTGQVNDPAVVRLHMRWQDGYEQNVPITDGMYLTTHMISSKGNGQSSADILLTAYDKDDQLLYKLTPEHYEIRAQ